MVVLSAAVCTKGGKALLARQYVDMSRVRVEGLLAAFPKLLSSEKKKEHTFIETDSVRYVYHPLEGLFLLLVTNKGSNIIEDLDTLSLLSKVVPDVCGPVHEASIKDASFELCFAFDEVLSYGGFREDTTLPQIRTNMEMESHEEKLAILIRISKMNEAKEEAKRKATMMREQRKAMGDSMDTRSMGGMGSGFGGGQSFGSGSRATAPPAPAPTARATGGSGGKPSASSRKMGRGMGLRREGKGTQGDAMSAMLREEGIDVGGAGSGPAEAAAVAASAPAAMVPATDTEARFSERAVITMGRDGGLEKMEVKGNLQLKIRNPDCTRVRVQMAKNDFSGFQFQPHPNINKTLWNNDKALELKDPSRGLPPDTDVGVLRWRSSTRDDTRVPLVINCWPEVSGGEVNVNIEYTLQRTDLELLDVSIDIPLGTDASPSIVACDGQHKHKPRDQMLTWHIDMIDESSASGTLEFNVAGGDDDVFFPLNVYFRSTHTLCPFVVESVTNLATESAGTCNATQSLEIDNYTIMP